MIDVPELTVTALPPVLVAEARAVWADRVRTEYRSIQTAARFLGEALAAGLPSSVIERIAATIDEEMRHTELCRRMCGALGGEVPAAAALAAPLDRLQDVPLDERVVASAISMFLISESFSVGYLEDLAQRATHPAAKAVLGAILGDEAEHEAFGPHLVGLLLQDAPRSRREAWRGFTRRLVAGHLERANRALRDVAETERLLERWPEPERASLGLHGQVRLALVCLRTHETRLLPALRELGLD